VRALFYGLGADGTVGANKNSIKIIGEDPAFNAQGYFVYDSKKSGSQTVSHLRFGPDPIRSSYLVQSANFIGCHAFNFLEQTNVLEKAAPGATFLLNSPMGPDTVWEHLPRVIQQTLIDKGMSFYVIDAYKVARESGMGNRINTVMQTCFFALSEVLPKDKAIAKIKKAIEKTYGKKGEEVVRKNFEAVDTRSPSCFRSRCPNAVTSTHELKSPVPEEAPEFVRKVTAMMMAGKGDALPVSILPADGTYPTATTCWEKRNISQFVPVWEPGICIQCGNCSFVCPHSVIRAKFYGGERLKQAPGGFKFAAIDARGLPDVRYTLQFEDCTGCGLCVEACPARSRGDRGDQHARRKRPRAGASRSSKHCPTSSAAGWTSRRCAACSSCSRCLNSRAPAPAAARPPTSSSFPSSSATA
jgi:pyruvate-ferredoxin/flavodoxin oxidoreductase